MSEIFKCPVCIGKGVVEKGFYEIIKKQIPTINTNEKTEICRTCKGIGIIWKNQDFITYKPIYDKPYSPCDNCPIRLSPTFTGVCHCTLPYFINPLIRW